MRKFAILTASTLALATLVYAATYSVVAFPTPGVFTPVGIGVAKVKAISIEGAYPNNGTVIISRISKDGATTNALLTRTVSSGSFTDDIGTGTNIYLFAGDRIQRSGTVTNECDVKLIVEN